MPKTKGATDKRKRKTRSDKGQPRTVKRLACASHAQESDSNPSWPAQTTSNAQAPLQQTHTVNSESNPCKSPPTNVFNSGNRRTLAKA